MIGLVHRHQPVSSSPPRSPPSQLPIPGRISHEERSSDIEQQLTGRFSRAGKKTLSGIMIPRRDRRILLTRESLNSSLMMCHAVHAPPPLLLPLLVSFLWTHCSCRDHPVVRLFRVAHSAVTTARTYLADVGVLYSPPRDVRLLPRGARPVEKHRTARICLHDTSQGHRQVTLFGRVMQHEDSPTKQTALLKL